MELTVARRLAWATERGGVPLPGDVAAAVGHVLAQGAEIEVATEDHFFEVPENLSQ